MLMVTVPIFTPVPGELQNKASNLDLTLLGHELFSQQVSQNSQQKCVSRLCGIFLWVGLSEPGHSIYLPIFKCSWFSCSQILYYNLQVYPVTCFTF